MVGRLLGHYRLLERVGSGGMGAVYRARDERLGREVAVKVLHAGALADPESRRRFRREALALSRLDHPGIATLHEFVSGQDVDFIVMEYLGGRSLARRLRDGPLAEDELVRIADEVAGALAAAHEQGIVHRDLKPSNILISDAGVKLVDFGLAKLETTQSQQVSERLSSLMPVGGTLHYMAPEQVLGHAVDARTDLYALGCVMYEMAAGTVPFATDDPAILCRQILEKRPPALRAPGRRLSPRLEFTIRRLLEKRPDRRHPDAAALRDDLRGWSEPLRPSGFLRLELARRGPRRLVGASLLGAAALGGGWLATDLDGVRRALGWEPAPTRSVAVLPFADLSNDPEQGFLAEGMTDEVIGELARGGGLRVISRTSAMRYKDTKKTVPQIGRELSVDAVVEGSIARRSDRVRLTARLIHAPSGRPLWGESYDRPAAELSSLRTELSLAIRGALHARRSSAPRDRPAPAPKAAAYDNLLRGRHSMGRGHEEDMKRALSYFLEAILLEPCYADAHASLAELYLTLGLVHAMPQAEAHPMAMASARRAVECDPGSAHGHAILGRILHVVEWRFDEAREHLKRAVDLNPQDPTVLRFYGSHLASMGRAEELLPVARRGYELDPVSVRACQLYAYGLKANGRLDEAIGMSFRALELDSTWRVARLELVESYWAKGMRRESCEQMLRCQEEEQREADRLGTTRDVRPGRAPYEKEMAQLRSAYERGGPEAYWRAELARLGPDYFNPAWIATLYIYLGDLDSAMVFLERAYAERSQALLSIKTRPDFWPLQTDERFQALLRKMGLSPDPLPFVRRMYPARGTRGRRRPATSTRPGPYTGRSQSCPPRVRERA